MLASPTMWLERAAGWAELTGYLFGLPVLTILMLDWRWLPGCETGECEKNKRSTRPESQ